ncbi:hypothetical protein PENSPDRAFT_687051 [Peniophora sp. CONT]|nr:hypothetical protein PENSPDRAFT_687051 [Peniophora sp. CONT]
MPLPRLRLPLAPHPNALHIKPSSSRRIVSRATSRASSCSWSRRAYATASSSTGAGAGTKHATAASLLTETLDRRKSGGRGGPEAVGPFQLGLGQQNFGGEKQKKWNELSTGGKAVRATARTSNMVVIMFGAGLTALLGYALTSELFSSNSPTVLYNEACERIKSNPRVSKYLPGTLVFHNNPPSAIRPRHRNRGVASQLVRDSSGREHLLLNFYIQAVPAYAATSYVDSALTWVESLPSTTTDDIRSWGRGVVDSTKDLFRYLTGDPAAPTTRTGGWFEDGTARIEERHVKEEGKGLWGSITGVFGSLRGASRSSSEERQAEAAGKYQEGEVHVDLIKDERGNFVFRYILIDIPNSHSRKPVRVFVERASGVSESVSVMRWDSA